MEIQHSENIESVLVKIRNQIEIKVNCELNFLFAETDFFFFGDASLRNSQSPVDFGRVEFIYMSSSFFVLFL